MPFNNYSPTYVFKGQVQCDNAPSEASDLVRKQDVSGLSYISSVDSSYFSVDSNGELSASNLLITDVKVNTSDSSLSDYITNSASGDNLGVGDIVILTAPSANLMYIVKSGTGSQTSDFEEIQSSLTAAEIASNLTGGTGIDVTSSGTINFNGDTDDVSEGSTNLYFTEARARNAITVANGSSLRFLNGIFSLNISNSGALGTGDTLEVKVDDTTIGINAANKLEIKGDTDDVDEGTTNQYFTDARARAAFSSGAGITISAGGEIASSITQYADSNARAALSVGNGLDYNASSGVFDLATAAGLEFNDDGDLEIANGDGLSFSDSGDLEVDEEYFRKEFTSQSFTAETAKTLTHNLGKKYVHVSIYDSSDNLVHAEVSLTDANNLTVTTSASLTGVTVVVSI